LIDITACGAVCNGDTQNPTDDTNAINCALDKVGLPPSQGGAGGGEVIIPPLTCIISPQPDPAPQQPPGPNDYLRLYDNLTIRGSGPKSILKVSIASAGNGYGRVFASPNFSLTNVVIKDFRIHQNPHDPFVPPSANKERLVIAPSVPTHGITISGMFFDPTDSPNTIIAAYPSSTGDLQATVTNNYFNFFKCPSPDPGPNGWYDVSTVLLEGSQQVIRNNTFTSVSLAQQAQSAIETLGGRSVIADNTFNNYAVPVLLVPSFAVCDPTGHYDPNNPDCSGLELNPSDVVIANNSVTCAGAGIVFWPTTGTTLRNVSITGNTLHICNAQRGLGGANGISTNWSPDYAKRPARGYQGGMDGLTITNNIIIMEKDDRSSNTDAYKVTSGILLRPIGNLKNVLVKGNIIKDAPVSGIRIGPDDYDLSLPTPYQIRPHTVQRIRILDNIIVDAGNNERADSVFRHAIGLDDWASDVEVMGNMIYDTATRPNSPNPLWGLNALYLQPRPASTNPPTSASTNVRTGKNIVRVSPTSTTYQLLSPQSSTGQLDTTGTSDVQVSSIQGASSISPPLFNVDFTSFTRYVVAITPPTGFISLPVAIKVAAPSPAPDVPNSKQFTHGQLVTFRFLCSSQVPANLGCLVQFDGSYATAGDLGGGGNPIASGKGRSISFQVEVPPSGSANHYFFELYRTSDVPNP